MSREKLEAIVHAYLNAEESHEFMVEVDCDEVFLTERKRVDKVICEEWERIVKEYELRPGNVTEIFMGRVINRVRKTT